jgi:hypothetical protein
MEIGAMQYILQKYAIAIHILLRRRAARPVMMDFVHAYALITIKVKAKMCSVEENTALRECWEISSKSTKTIRISCKGKGNLDCKVK